MTQRLNITWFQRLIMAFGIVAMLSILLTAEGCSDRAKAFRRHDVERSQPKFQ